MKRPPAVALVLALAAPLFLLGCGKDNPVKPIDDPQPFVYPDQSTPANTVRRMAAALANRNSVMTDSVYADDYEGTSIDATDPGSGTLTFSKSDEVAIVETFAQSASITHVSMDLYSPASWNQTHYGSDPPGWTTIQIPNFEITVSDIHGDGYQVHSPTPGDTWVFEFTLRPTPDDTSPTDTTWTIVRWVESRAQN